jgi:GT2 family glycosyltransferase
MLENLIVPVLNRYDLLQRMLDSVDEPVEHLLVIDNGASNYPDDAQVNYLRFSEQFQNVHYLPMPANLGVAASWNLGFKVFPHHGRWFFTSNDMWFGPGAIKTLSEARRDEITLSKDFPFWQTFCVGDEALSKVGLFDEALFPAYFEDNDYQRRAEHFGVNIRSIDIVIGHDNSSTINSDPNLMGKNSVTFANNAAYYSEKVGREDYGPGGWLLERRRMNAWDSPR